MFSRRIVVFATIVAAFAVPSTAMAACPNEALTPAADNLAEVRAALLCLHNEERATRGLPALKENAKLRRAAAARTPRTWSRTAISGNEPGDGTFVDRIVAPATRAQRRLVARREPRLGHR